MDEDSDAMRFKRFLEEYPKQFGFKNVRLKPHSEANIPLGTVYITFEICDDSEWSLVTDETGELYGHTDWGIKALKERFEYDLNVAMRKDLDKYADLHRCYQTLAEGNEPNEKWYLEAESYASDTITFESFRGRWNIGQTKEIEGVQLTKVSNAYGSGNRRVGAGFIMEYQGHVGEIVANDEAGYMGQKPSFYVLEGGTRRGRRGTRGGRFNGISAKDQRECLIRWKHKVGGGTLVIRRPFKKARAILTSRGFRPYSGVFRPPSEGVSRANTYIRKSDGRRQAGRPPRQNEAWLGIRYDAESFEAFTHCDNCEGESGREDGRYYKKYDCFDCDVQLCGFCHTNGLHDCPNADYTDWNRLYNCKYCGDPMCEKGGDEHTQEELERKWNAESFRRVPSKIPPEVLKIWKEREQKGAESNGDLQLHESKKRTKMSMIRTGLAITTFAIVMWNLRMNKKQERDISNIKSEL